MKRVLIFTVIVFMLSLTLISAPGLWAADFGMIVNGHFKTEGGDETTPSGKLILAPWLFLPLGEADLRISAGLNADIAKENAFAPELFRLEFSYKPSAMFSFRLGRFYWQDPSRFTAKGHYDGLELSFDLGKVRLSAAALYTGFSYKDTAEVNVSPKDQNDYNAVLDWQNFADTYFAPRRLLAVLSGEFPGFPPGWGHFYAGLMAQFDLSNADERFHTQYLFLRHALSYKIFDLSAVGAAELENTEDEGIRAAFAAALEGGWQLPGSIKDRLSLGVRWASGNGPNTAAYFPITTEAQGVALKPNLSGMMIIKLNYEVRLHPAFSAEIGARYFIRTDSTSFTLPELEDDSYLLGAEFNTSMLWVPLSDLSFSLNGGIFIPKTGNAMSSDAAVRWAITIGTILSL